MQTKQTLNATVLQVGIPYSRDTPESWLTFSDRLTIYCEASAPCIHFAVCPAVCSCCRSDITPCWTSPVGHPRACLSALARVPPHRGGSRLGGVSTLGFHMDGQVQVETSGVRRSQGETRRRWWATGADRKSRAAPARECNGRGKERNAHEVMTLHGPPRLIQS